MHATETIWALRNVPCAAECHQTLVQSIAPAPRHVRKASSGCELEHTVFQGRPKDLVGSRGHIMRRLLGDTTVMSDSGVRQKTTRRSIEMHTTHDHHGSTLSRVTRMTTAAI